MEYHFDSFRLDPDRKLLFKSNELVEVDSRTFHFLVLLLQRFPETVTRRELLDTLWPNQEISDWALSQLIRRTRLILGDDGRAPTYIKTIHGVGVRFLVEPSEQESATTQEPVPSSIPGQKFSPAKWWWTLIPALMLVWLGSYSIFHSEEKLDDLGNYPNTIALLPFDNASGDVAHAWIELGLMDMIGQLLGESVGIQTLSTQDVVAFLNNNPTPDIFASPDQMAHAFDSVCNALGCQILVAARLDGTVPRPNISYQVATKERVHTVKYAHGNTIMAAGSDLAEQLIHLIDPAQPWAVNTRDTYSADDAANRAYALGTQELFNSDTQMAIQYLNIALQKAPSFDWAKLKLADAYYRENNLESSTALVDELLEKEHLAPGIRYQALHVRSNILYSQGKLMESRESSEILLRLARESGDLILQSTELMNIGTSFQATGETDKALQHLEESLELYRKTEYQPGIGMTMFNIGNVYTTVFDYQQAAPYYQKAELIFQQLGNEQYVSIVRFQRASIYKNENQYDKAKKLLSNLVMQFERLGDDEGSALALVELTHIDILEGRYKQAVKKLEDKLPELEVSNLQNAIQLAHDRLAQAYLNLHKPGAARLYIGQDSKSQPQNLDSQLFQAHLAYEEHRFSDAVAIGEKVKLAAGSAWLESHENFLIIYKRAKVTGQWREITF